MNTSRKSSRFGLVLVELRGEAEVIRGTCDWLVNYWAEKWRFKKVNRSWQ